MNPTTGNSQLLLGVWAHSASYLVGFVGGAVLIAFVLLGKQRQPLQSG